MSFNPEIVRKQANPGQLLIEESYGRLSDHPEYMEYLRRDGENKIVWFERPGIMDFWTQKPLCSEGFNVCHALVAVKPALSEAQAIHVSPDPWFRTDTNALQQRISEWQAEQAGLILVHDAPRSTIYQYEIDELVSKFGSRFANISLGVSSRFGMVYDVQNKLLLVQLTDAKLLRVYRGF